ncbi:10777_t:CDS:2, partial [Gigaspora rosea]
MSKGYLKKMLDVIDDETLNSAIKMEWIQKKKSVEVAHEVGVE